ncbi:hypothetical protein E0L36_15795 [Streptomyces sp. AJS327]|uniref:hypothetical protein n=1 Tax=Streptomyces sp. AJS327 TaxID=2545265 RepID=UPI0015DF5E52|nr:hypothetical protein [Streptomyces sp. AJS327]MBA0052317.1 hypothetical protein [Streptomyces sp. AJS327]
MTSHGAEGPSASDMTDAEEEVAGPDWEHPLTRLMLLLEIAGAPSLLNAAATQAQPPPAPGPGA